MQARQLWTWALSCSALAFGCSAADGGAVQCHQFIQPRNVDEVALCNDLAEPLVARVALPEGEPPADGWPGVVLLHGSTGLFRADEDGGCSEELLGRFRDWSTLLNEQGYAVIMPASFYSRGFCDWTEGEEVPRDYDELERLVTRSYDAAAAGRWLCMHPQVDCSRLGVFGFSNGASVAMLVMHEDLGVADDPRLGELQAPPFVGGVAYYPGCGLDSQLANSLGEAELGRYFYPQGPMWIPHAEKDHLLERCEWLRDPQVDTVAELRGVDQDMFELEVYPGAKHGFDVWFEGDPGADLEAQTDAQQRTLAKLALWLKG